MRYTNIQVLVWSLLTTTVLCLCACQSERHERRLSAYYWSTVFHLDSAQQAFIHDHHISRIYLRMFDVVPNGGRPMPNASVQVLSPRPDSVEVVPTVFIINDCLLAPQPQLDSLIYTRVLQMCQTHDLGRVHEIQLDCDWTQRTQSNYYDLLRHLRERARAQGVSVSSTIRLHQLSQAPPPADRGVLMMYNTGDVTRRDGTDPILDMSDVRPYLKGLKDYDLPLSAAYPVFEWRVAFRGSKYLGIVHADEYLPLLPGDTILTRQGTPEMVRRAVMAIDSLRPGANDEMIIYDISKQNIQRFNTYHYEKAFDSHSAGFGMQR